MLITYQHYTLAIITNNHPLKDILIIKQSKNTITVLQCVYFNDHVIEIICAKKSKQKGFYDRIKAVVIPPPNIAGTTNRDMSANKPNPEIPWPLYINRLN